MTLQAELNELHTLGLSDRAIAREIGFSRAHVQQCRAGASEGSAAMHTLVSLLLESRTDLISRPPVIPASIRGGNVPPARMPTEPPARLSAGADIAGKPIIIDPMPPFLENGPSWHALERAAWWSMVAILGLLAGWALIQHPDLQGVRDLIMWLVSE
jgi:hypothetical protein